MSYNVSAHYVAETNMENRLKADAKPSVGILYGRNRPSYQTNDNSARLTLTYRDRFENKYAQTFDYDHNRKSWIYLSHPTVIAQDFFDLLSGIT
jgi:hypothetical protein